MTLKLQYTTKRKKDKDNKRIKENSSNRVKILSVDKEIKRE